MFGKCGARVEDHLFDALRLAGEHAAAREQRAQLLRFVDGQRRVGGGTARTPPRAQLANVAVAVAQIHADAPRPRLGPLDGVAQPVQRRPLPRLLLRRLGQRIHVALRTPKCQLHGRGGCRAHAGFRVGFIHFRDRA